MRRLVLLLLRVPALTALRTRWLLVRRIVSAQLQLGAGFAWAFRLLLPVGLRAPRLICLCGLLALRRQAYPLWLFRLCRFLLLLWGW
jgi:hypothetical protein